MGAFLARGVGFFHRWWGMRELSLEEYADFALFASLFYALIPVSGFGLTSSIARLLADRKCNLVDGRQVYVSALIIGFSATLFSCLLFVSFLPDTVNAFSTGEVCLAVFIGLMGSALMQIHMGVALGCKNFSRVAFFEAGEAISRVVILVVFIAVGIHFQWLSLFWSLVMAAPLTVLVLNASNFSAINFRWLNKEVWMDAWGPVKKILPHAVSVVTISFSVLIVAYILRLFSRAGGVEEVAYLDSAFVFYGIPRLFFSALVRPLIPLVAESDSHSKFILEWWVCLLIIIMPIPIGITVVYTGFGESLFLLLGLSGYQAATTALGILICGSGVDFLFGYMSSHLQGLNKAKILAVLCVVCVIPVLFVMWLFEGYGDSRAAAAIFTFYYSVLTLVAWLYLKSIKAN